MESMSHEVSNQQFRRVFRYYSCGFKCIISAAAGSAVTVLLWSGMMELPRALSVLVGCGTLWFTVTAGYAVRRSHRLFRDLIGRINRRAANRLERMARVTETGSSYDWLYLLARAREEQDRVDRCGGVVAFMALRIDGPPEWEGGVDLGREAMEEIAERLASRLRPFDELRCAGSAEFMVVCPHMGRRDARHAASDLCRYLRGSVLSPWEGPGDARFTVRVGLAAYPINGDTAQDAISAACEAVRRAGESAGVDMVVSEDYVNSSAG
jgi:GGDEF domain-containing protein